MSLINHPLGSCPPALQFVAPALRNVATVEPNIDLYYDTHTASALPTGLSRLQSQPCLPVVINAESVVPCPSTQNHVAAYIVQSRVDSAGFGIMCGRCRRLAENGTLYAFCAYLGGAGYSPVISEHLLKRYSTVAETLERSRPVYLNTRQPGQAACHCKAQVGRSGVSRTEDSLSGKTKLYHVEGHPRVTTKAVDLQGLLPYDRFRQQKFQ